MANWDSIGALINDAAVEVGLAEVSDPLTSQDPNFVLFYRLAKSLGQRLWRERQWTHLQQLYNFTTVSGQGRYNLPSDFGGMIDQSGWNRTNRLPLGGALSPQQWQYLKARMAGAVFNVLFRQMQGQIWIYPDVNTPAGFQIDFEYISRFWLQPFTTATSITDAIAINTWRGAWEPSVVYATNELVSNQGQMYSANIGGTSGTYGPTVSTGTQTDGSVTWVWVGAMGLETPEASSDYVLYDPLLFRYGLKLAFLQTKGFDSNIAQSDYDKALEQAIANDTQASVLLLGGGPGWQEPLLGEQNIPITGFGS